MRLAFMGTPAFSVPSLHALLKAGHEVAAVYTQPPRPAGRGKKLQLSPVHQAAHEAGIEVLTPSQLRNAPVQLHRFQQFGIDAAIVVAYGILLPPDFLAAPRLGCINVHASLLPRWRGAAPIQAAIMAGDAQTGISIMQMDAGLDTGPLLAKSSLMIPADETASTLHDKLAQLGADLLTETLRHPLKAIPQPESGTTYAGRLTKEMGRLDWTRPAHELERQIRALTPWPSCTCLYRGDVIKVGKANVVSGLPSAAPGFVLDDKLTVQCGLDALQLVQLQRPGKAMLEHDAFLRGLPIKKGEKFD